jgi:hypothetical protein
MEIGKPDTEPKREAAQADKHGGESQERKAASITLVETTPTDKSKQKVGAHTFCVEALFRVVPT